MKLTMVSEFCNSIAWLINNVILFYIHEYQIKII